jgi:nucleotide-binding universal stress UspA family protein
VLVLVLAHFVAAAANPRSGGAFEGMLLGSVSHAVIHGSRCAVAAVGDFD